MEGTEHDAIVERFFAALQWLKGQKKLRGMKTFCVRYGIHRSTLRRIQYGQTRELRAVWVVYLVRDYGISAQWILTGEGEIHG